MACSAHYQKLTDACEATFAASQSHGAEDRTEVENAAFPNDQAEIEMLQPRRDASDVSDTPTLKSPRHTVADRETSCDGHQDDNEDNRDGNANDSAPVSHKRKTTNTLPTQQNPLHAKAERPDAGAATRRLSPRTRAFAAVVASTQDMIDRIEKTSDENAGDGNDGDGVDGGKNDCNEAEEDSSQAADEPPDQDSSQSPSTAPASPLPGPDLEDGGNAANRLKLNWTVQPHYLPHTIGQLNPTISADTADAFEITYPRRAPEMADEMRMRLAQEDRRAGARGVAAAAGDTAERQAVIDEDDVRFGGAKTGATLKDHLAPADVADEDAKQERPSEFDDAFEAIAATREGEHIGKERDLDTEYGRILWGREEFASISWEQQPQVWRGRGRGSQDGGEDAGALDDDGSQYGLRQRLSRSPDSQADELHPSSVLP